MKVIFITEGGSDIGFGHITRCISLCQAFEERGIAPEFVVNGDGVVGDLLKGRKYWIFNWLEEKERLFNIIKDASIVVVDSYIADSKLYKKVSETVKIPVYLDDNRRIDYPKGFVVNGTIYAEELDYPRREGITYLLGSRYTPLRKEFLEPCEKEIRDEIESIMITFGGDDMRGLTPKVLELLNKEFPKLTKNVIIGKGFQDINIKEIETLKNTKTNLIYNPESGKIKEIMLESDIAISAGGQTLYEFARIGMPTIGICVADNQERNLNEWQKRGFIEYAGWHDDGNLSENLKRSMAYLGDVKIRKNKSEIGKEFVDGRGSLRAVKIILSNLLKNELTLRKASFDDASAILNLANDEAVRQNSFNPEKIERKHHLRWLREKLDDNNCVYFIAAMYGKFYGQVRFEINPEKEEATINISLNKDIRGLGLGPFIINKSIEELLKVCSYIKLIKAYIKEENTSSVKTFEKADFKFCEDIIHKGVKAKLHKREISYVGV